MKDLIDSVIETLTPKELEAQDKDEHWYSLQIRPYRTTDDKIDGAVVVLWDIDAAKQASERLKKSELFMKETLATVREPLVVLKQDLTALYVNPAFTNTFKAELTTQLRDFLSRGLASATKFAAEVRRRGRDW